MATATLVDGGEIRHMTHPDRNVGHILMLYTARGVCIWRSRGPVPAIRPALATLRATWEGVDLDRDDDTIAADERAQAAYLASERAFNAGS